MNIVVGDLMMTRLRNSVIRRAVFISKLFISTTRGCRFEYFHHTGNLGYIVPVYNAQVKVFPYPLVV